MPYKSKSKKRSAANAREARARKRLETADKEDKSACVIYTEVDYQLVMLNSRSNSSAQGNTLRTDEFPSCLQDSLIDLG
jgi:hypothetical protein